MIRTCDIGETEGDVETKIILPILQKDTYLGIPNGYIKSKDYLSPRDIDKGGSKKSGYYPDFAVFINSLPVCVIEAKSPENSTQDAYREACLYAHEINRSYPSQINPCCVVIGSNGKTIRAGFWDSDPVVNCPIEDLVVGSKTLSEFQELSSFGVLTVLSDEISSKLRLSDFRRPFNQGEGPALINSKIGSNTFAADLSPILRRYFTSHSQQEEREIYERAYILSSEIQSHDRNLQAFLKDRITRSKSAGRTELRPKKSGEPHLEGVVKSQVSKTRSEGVLQLLTGPVGAGKSLFVRRYKEFLQPNEIADVTHWAFLNFNDAPPRLKDAKEWACSEFVNSLSDEGAPFDLTDGRDQERIFSSKIRERRAFYDRVNKVNEGRGELEKARDYEQWRQDPEICAECLSRYLQGDRGGTIVAVFDNVDRRDTEEQLITFQLALWFMSQMRCLLILQMRDVTFERFKNEPPLDTYRSGTVFHISPPRFVEVVRRRLELSLEHLSIQAPDTVTYTLSSGTRISYPRSKAGEFLNAIYSEIFQRPRNISTIVEALAGRDVRRALDMFMSIITSGHMSEENITNIARGSRENAISEYQIIRILMRGDYRYFSENSGFIANIFYCDSNWVRPSNFIIPEILFWLFGKRKLAGDNGQMGYFSVLQICEVLGVYGFVNSDVFDACRYALKNNLIEADTLSVVELSLDDCVKITASGWVHMRLLSERMEYLASVLPVTPINNSGLRSVIFDKMRIENKFGDLRFHQIRDLTKHFQQYLAVQKTQLDKHHEYANEKKSGAVYILSKIDRALSGRSKKNGKGGGSQLDLLDG